MLVVPPLPVLMFVVPPAPVPFPVLPVLPLAALPTWLAPLLPPAEQAYTANDKEPRHTHEEARFNMDTI